MKQFDFCVFIGRFSTFHNAHLEILEHAFDIAKEVIVVIGSSGTARNIRNPWTSAERQVMITSCLNKEQLSRVQFVHMKDYLYNNNMWVSVLQEKIRNITGEDKNVALIGYESDESSFYLNLFPQFTFVNHGESIHKFHAVDIREKYFSYDLSYKTQVPAQVFSFLEDFKKTEVFNALKNEQDYVNKYKEAWRGAPFTPIFSTVDALVIKSGHILLVQRGHNPGKGLYSLPGGFLNSGETLEDGALRELKEETKIKINISDLRRNIVDSRVFDDPKRSVRGRVITHVFMIDLGSGQLPFVKGSDDAKSAQWIPLSDYYELGEQFFEDHFHIIRSMISKY